MPEQVTNQTKTLADIVTETQFLLADGSLIFPQVDVERAINTGLSMVHNTFHRELIDAYFDTEAGYREYEIPDTRYDGGEANIEQVWVDGEVVDVVDYEVPTESAKPTGWTLRGNSVVFDNTPDAAYPVHIIYRREFKPLVNATDTTTMSDVEISAGIFYAIYLLKLKDEEFQSANSFKQAYNDAMAVAGAHPAGLYSGEDGRMK